MASTGSSGLPVVGALGADAETATSSGYGTAHGEGAGPAPGRAARQRGRQAAEPAPCLALPRPFQERARGNRAPGSGGSRHGAGATPPTSGPLSLPASVPLLATCTVLPSLAGAQRRLCRARPSASPAAPAQRPEGGLEGRPRGDTSGPGARAGSDPSTHEARASSFVVLNGEHNMLTKQETAPRPRPGHGHGHSPGPPGVPQGRGPAPAPPPGLATQHWPAPGSVLDPRGHGVSHRLPRGPRRTRGREPGCDLGRPLPDSRGNRGAGGARGAPRGAGL